MNEGAGRVASARDTERKERAEVGGGQEQLAGEQRHKATSGQSRKPMPCI